MNFGANESNGFYVQTRKDTYGASTFDFSIVSERELKAQIKAGEEKYWQLYPAEKTGLKGLLAFAAIAAGGIALSVLGPTVGGAAAAKAAATEAASASAATTAATGAGSTAASVGALLPKAASAVKGAAGLAASVGGIQAAAKGEPPPDWVGAANILANSDDITQGAVDVTEYLAQQHGIKIKDEKTRQALREYMRRRQKLLAEKAAQEQKRQETKNNGSYWALLIPVGLFAISRMG